MKEFIEKLIGRLEELYNSNDKMKKKAYEEQDWENFELFTHGNEGVKESIEIVKQLAEEYKGGWIPCSNGTMPNENETIMLTFKNSAGLHVGEATYKNRMFFYVTDTEFGYYEEVYKNPIAWKPKDAPYQPKGVSMADCRKCKHNYKPPTCEPKCKRMCDGESDFEPITNADRIRSMSDKQMAIFLKPLIGTLTEEEIFKWLQTESQEEIAITPEMKADMVDCIKETKIPGGGKDCNKCSINNTNYCGKPFCEVEWIRNKMLQEARGDK